MKILCNLIITLLCTLRAFSADENPAVPVLKFGTVNNTNVLSLTFSRKADDGDYTRVPLIVVSNSVLTPESFKVTEIENGKEKTLKVIEISYSQGPRFIRNLRLYTDPQPVDGRTYKVDIKEGAIALAYNGVPLTLSGFSASTLGAGSLVVAPGLTRKIELAAGTPGGIASVDLQFKKHDWYNTRALNFQFKGKADLTLSSKEKQKYFNNLTADGSLYTHRDLVGQRVEFSGGAKLESDQTIDTVNVLGGVGASLYIPNRITDWIQSLAPIENFPSVGPFAMLRYDYVHNVNDKLGIVTGGDDSHRGTALLKWSFFLYNDLDLSMLKALGSKTTVRLDIELKGIYDELSEDFHDQSRVSLVFEPRGEENSLKPAVVFTWARGKESPTFEQVNALLAGLKIAF